MVVKALESHAKSQKHHKSLEKAVHIVNFFAKTDAKKPTSSAHSAKNQILNKQTHISSL